MKRLILLFSLAALCISCSPVPYDTGLAEAAKTLLKMTQDNPAVVTVDFGSSPIEQEQVQAFYPRVTATGFDYGMGFVITSDVSNLMVHGVSYDTSKGMLVGYGGWNYFTTIPNQDPHYPAWSAWPTKDNPVYDAHVFMMSFDSLYPLSINRFALIKGQVGSPPIFSVLGNNDMHSQINADLTFNAEVLGGSVDADTDITRDYTYWLVRQAGGSQFAELASSVWSGGVNVVSLRSSGYPYTLSFIPAGVKRLQYFFDENQAGDPARNPNSSFASWYDSTAGKWICWRWAEDPPVSGAYPYVQIPIDHRIDAMLSTGQLLSTEGMGRLYNRDGGLITTFPLGTLKFLSEEYVGGEARTYFCQYLPYDGMMHFNVYWIRTDALANLGS